MRSLLAAIFAPSDGADGDESIADSRSHSVVQRSHQIVSATICLRNCIVHSATVNPPMAIAQLQKTTVVTKFILAREKFSKGTCQVSRDDDIIGEVDKNTILILGSSVVERSTVNRLVASSSLARGVNHH
jgi:hypothetical protein